MVDFTLNFNTKKFIFHLDPNIRMNMNNTTIPDFRHQFEQKFSFQPGVFIKPLMSMWYGYQCRKLYNKYKHKLEPVDVLELNCLFERAIGILLHTHLNLSSVLPDEPWICFTLNFLLLLSMWSFDVYFLATQVQKIQKSPYCQLFILRLNLFYLFTWTPSIQYISLWRWQIK